MFTRIILSALDKERPIHGPSVISGSMSQPDFPVSGIPLNEWNLPIRRSRNRQWQAFFLETGAWAVRQHKVHTKHDE